ncbi:MAG: hypothetical protein CL681_04740 [Blastopirellula sp.]|nr:hypothetical protein [Blastopirellula sp.]|tara:strand:- start:406 stop:678 length:273 start_codon:yes stop_codon:yes gene_type:complete
MAANSLLLSLVTAIEWTPYSVLIDTMHSAAGGCASAVTLFHSAAITANPARRGQPALELLTKHHSFTAHKKCFVGGLNYHRLNVVPWALQ